MALSSYKQTSTLSSCKLTTVLVRLCQDLRVPNYIQITALLDRVEKLPRESHQFHAVQIYEIRQH